MRRAPFQGKPLARLAILFNHFRVPATTCGNASIVEIIHSGDGGPVAHCQHNIKARGAGVSIYEKCLPAMIGAFTVHPGVMFPHSRRQ